MSIVVEATTAPRAALRQYRMGAHWLSGHRRGASPVGGAAGRHDRPKARLLVGLTLFGVGSAACGAAPTLGALIAGRLLQGVGAACIFSVSIAMISRAFPPGERGRALGINAVISGLGVSAGPSVGGVITQRLTRWRSLPLDSSACRANDELDDDADENEVQNHLQADNQPSRVGFRGDVAETDGGQHADREVEVSGPV